MVRKEIPTEESPQPNFRYRWAILGVCWLAYIVAFMHRLSIGPLAPFLKEDLNLNGTQVGGLMSAAAFGYMLALVPAGWAVDRIGIRLMLFIGELVGGIFIFGMTFVTTFTGGLICMALAGTGMGCLMPATTKAILVWFPLEERATAMGFKQTGVNVGGIITAAVLPAVALTIGWLYAFIGIGLVAMGLGIVSLILYKEPFQIVGISTDNPGSLWVARSSVLEVFKSREIWLLNAAGLCVITVEFSLLAHFVLYLTEMLFFAVVTGGFFLAVLETGGAFGKPVSGLISDRLFHGNRKNPYILMCVVICIVCMTFVFTRPGSPSWMMGLLCFLLGLGSIGWGSLHFTLVGEFAGRKVAGAVTGISAAFIMIGSVVGPIVFGYLFDATGSYQAGWQLLAILATVASVLLVFVREEKRRI